MSVGRKSENLKMVMSQVMNVGKVNFFVVQFHCKEVYENPTSKNQAKI